MGDPSEKTMKHLLTRAGIRAERIRPTGAGHYNDSYIVTAPEGSFVLRIAPPDDVPKLFYEKAMMRSEPRLHELVLNRTDIPVPRIVFHDFSREIIDRDWLVMEFLEGTPGHFDHEELGRYVRQLHAITGDAYGYPDREAPTGRSWPEVFFLYAELIFNDCLSCGIISPEEHRWFLSAYRSHRDAVEECEPRLLHLDLWSQNILTRDGRITALLDFDRGLYGDPELEFAVLETYATATPAFFRGYGSPRPEGKHAAARRVLYLVYELIKYAFIRYARGGSRTTGRMHVAQCARILSSLS